MKEINQARVSHHAISRMHIHQHRYAEPKKEGNVTTPITLRHIPAKLVGAKAEAEAKRVARIVALNMVG
jgi:hypothetical protein